MSTVDTRATVESLSSSKAHFADAKHHNQAVHTPAAHPEHKHPAVNIEMSQRMHGIPKTPTPL